MFASLKLSLESAGTSLSEKFTPKSAIKSSSSSSSQRQLEDDLMLMKSYLKVIKYLELEFEEISTPDLVTEMTNILTQAVDLASNLNLRLDMNQNLDNQEPPSSSCTEDKVKDISSNILSEISQSTSLQVVSRKSSNISKVEDNDDEMETNELLQVEKDYIEIVYIVQRFLKMEKVQRILYPTWGEVSSTPKDVSMFGMSDGGQVSNLSHQSSTQDEGTDQSSTINHQHIKSSSNKMDSGDGLQVSESAQGTVGTEGESIRNNQADERTIKNEFQDDDPEFNGYIERFEPNSLDYLNKNSAEYSHYDTDDSIGVNSPIDSQSSVSAKQSRSSRRAIIQAHQIATKRLEEILTEIRENLRHSSSGHMSENNDSSRSSNMTTEETLTDLSVYDRIRQIEKNTSTPVFPKDYKTPPGTPPHISLAAPIASPLLQSVSALCTVPTSKVVRPSPLLHTLDS